MFKNFTLARYRNIDLGKIQISDRSLNDVLVIDY